MKKHFKWILPLGVLMILVAAFLIYTANYYQADPEAVEALKSDDSVSVTQTGYGWFFDGISEDDVLIFYPGAKVEETAYAPMLHLLAEEGMDVCLVKMPFHLAFFGMSKAGRIPEIDTYENRYIGGHSLGGAMAAYYAARHGKELSGVILFAAYPTKKLDDHLKLLSVYGSEDGVLNMEKVAEGRQFFPDRFQEFKIPGGNHAGFGNYGIQKGDGTASISAAEQQKLTVEFILGQLGIR